MAKSNERPGKGWYSKAELCEFHDIAQQTFDKTYRGIIPPHAVKKIGPRVWYHGGAYVAALRAKDKADAKAIGDGVDPMLEGGGDSPWLEKYREQKTHLAAMEVEERRGSLVRIDVIEPVLLEAAGILRQGVAQVERNFGRAPAEMFLESVKEFGGKIEKYFADRSTRETPTAKDVEGD